MITKYCTLFFPSFCLNNKFKENQANKIISVRTNQKKWWSTPEFPLFPRTRIKEDDDVKTKNPQF